MDQALSTKSWFLFLEHSQQDLVNEAFVLLSREKQSQETPFHDYSFIVFPLAKAYEGFLKKYFFRLGVITERHYKSSHFRIGKSLNPDLPSRYRRDDWIVEKLDQTCPHPVGNDGEKLSRFLWRTWKQCRNLLFHYFPDHQNFIDLTQAELRVELLTEAMDLALKCEALNQNNN
jgi:hypothetical protein